jgi:hypothetical protein
VSERAHPYASFGSSPSLLARSPLRSGGGVVSFTLGLMVAFGMVAYVAWLAVAAVTAIGNAAQHVSGSVTGSVPHRDSVAERVAAPLPVATLPGPTPPGATLPFDHLWISHDGNTIVAGTPMVGISATTGESMIQVPVTLTNNGERNWRPESTSFVGTLNHAPVPESTEGDWMYRAPIVPHTSVTLTKIFLGRPGQFTLKVSTPQETASFAGRI